MKNNAISETAQRKRGRPSVMERYGESWMKYPLRGSTITKRTQANDVYSNLGNVFARAALGKEKWEQAFFDNNGNSRGECILIEIGRSLKSLSCRDEMYWLAETVRDSVEYYLAGRQTVHEITEVLRYMRITGVYAEAVRLYPFPKEENTRRGKCDNQSGIGAGTTSLGGT